MKYFFKVDHTYSTKNRLHKDLQEFVKKVDGTLMLSKRGKRVFLHSLKIHLKKLQDKHSRCKKVILDINPDFRKQGETWIYVSGNFSANIFPVKNELL